MLETAEKSLRHSCRSELTRQGIRYLRTVIVTAAVYWGFRNELAPIALTFQHRAGVRPYTSTYVLAEPVFLINSRFSWLVPPSNSCLLKGLPYSEVTEAFCRVPSTSFSQAPKYTLLIHLCRFRVRINDGAISWNLFAASSIH